MGFERVRLGDVVELRRGFDLPAPSRRPGDVPVVSSKGITGRHDVSRVAAPGVVTGRTGTLGKVFFLERDFWPLNTTLFVADFKGNDPHFVSLLLRSLPLAALNDKAAVPGVHREQLMDVVVPHPPPRAQRAIARALAPLERRAAVLRRMERTLARMAAVLYAAAPPGPPISVGGLCASAGNGATPPRGEPRWWDEGDVPWYRSGELDDGPLAASLGAVARAAVDEGVVRVWPAGTVLVALYASPTVGRLGVLGSPASANQACCALVPRPPVGPWTLFHALLATRARLRRMAVGAVQQNISQRVVLEHEVRPPCGAAAGAFERRAARIHAARAAHRREIAVLAAWQEALIPEALAGRLGPNAPRRG